MYLAEVVSSMLSIIFVIFAVAALGYLLGGIQIKGISLGTAGVLIVALAYGVLLSYVPSFNMFGNEIILLGENTKSLFSLVSSLGTALFVTAVGLIAGPKFFRTFNKRSVSYLCLGVIIIAIGTITALIIAKVTGTDINLMIGLLTGALTSTPGLAAAKEVAATEAAANAATAGYGIAYLFGVLGVVLFVQVMPKIMRVNIAEENAKFIQIKVDIKDNGKKFYKLEGLGFFPFFLAIALGVIIGSIKIPGINFSLGTSGGTLIAGLIIGHFGHIGPIDCKISKESLNMFRELGLVLFLIGAGVPGGMNFVENVKVAYFIYGVILTMMPMIIGFLIAKYVFKLSIFNNLGSITGGMTSTPALGTLINVAGTEDVASAYAATYPISLISVVVSSQLIIMLFL